jgi:4-aminobutyrate aminotransferase-like enzyme
VAAAAALAVLRVLEREELMANAQATGRYLSEQLALLAARHEIFGAVRGHGLLQGLPVLAPDAAAARLATRRIVNALAADCGVLIGAEGPHGDVLKLRPPMPFGREHVDLLIRALESVAWL